VISEDEQKGPWRLADPTDNWWRCRECCSTVSRGSYPSHWAHLDSCSYSIRPLIERAERAERQIDELHDRLRAERSSHLTVEAKS
jgi:hypothetical protein